MIKRIICILILAVIAVKAQVLYQKPIEGEEGKDWIISNYIDIDPKNNSYKDYMGGSLTYDGHGGIDFAIKDFYQMMIGVDIYAARSGKIVYLKDGMYDKETKRSKKKANAISIQHTDGSIAYYAHMKENSITKLGLKLGDMIKVGQKIGEVGSSGDSTGPHLHFHIRQNGKFIDPMTDRVHRFDFNPKYKNNMVFQFGVTDLFINGKTMWKYSPNSAKCINSGKKDRLILWLKYNFMDKGDTFSMAIDGPTPIKSKTKERDKDYKCGGYFFRYKNVQLKEGDYNMNIYYNNQIVATKPFVVKDNCN
jgi:hypothetical protein